MNKKFMLVLASLVLCVGVLAACGGGGGEKANEGGNATGGNTNTATEAPAAPDNTGRDMTYDAASAEAVYTSTCIACHGADYKGGIGSDLSAIGSTLSAAEIESIIINGKPGTAMNAQTSVSPAEAANLANYLASEKK
jgi:mono/diheme cytochrome c family protein